MIAQLYHLTHTHLHVCNNKSNFLHFREKKVIYQIQISKPHGKQQCFLASGIPGKVSGQ